MDRTEDARLKYLTDILAKSYGEHGDIVRIDAGRLLNRRHIIEGLEKLRNLIFPGYFGKKNVSSGSAEYYAGNLLEELLDSFAGEIGKALEFDNYAGLGAEIVAEKAERIAFLFLSKLPLVREYLAADVAAAFDGDPAATSPGEIIISYPGIYAIMVYRLAHVLHGLEVPLIPRIMTEHAHSVTGIDIHPGASIGHHFFIDHGTGIVIGETTVIGSFVKIYQGVTLGALSTRGGRALRAVKRHPTIENHVTIYSGASILGGATVIGEGVVIGSNAFITESVPEKTRVSIKDPELQFKPEGMKDRAREEAPEGGFRGGAV
jgi:serine O-acetyltransferase